jgi:pimeloyl-[acyl-carrier protein] methyl ester esterase
MSLHVQISGQGPDLVLLHGWAMHGGVFDALLPALAQQYRVHCIDLPGHGRSDPDAAVTHLEQLTNSVAQNVPENALVIGWSLGGLVAIKLAQQKKLQALVLVSTTPRFVADDSWPHGMSPNVFAQFFSRLQQNLNATVQDFLRLQVRADSEAASTFAALKANLLQYPADPLALKTGLEILRDADERMSLPGIDVPTLVLAGEYDRIVHPDACQYLAEQLPQARLHIVQRAGHALFLSHRDEFLQTLTEFTSNKPAAISAHG